MSTALLDASRRWASRLPTVTVLMGSDESDGPADDTQCLLEAWHELGLCVDLVPWQQAAPPLGLVLPLGAWDYAEHRDPPTPAPNTLDTPTLDATAATGGDPSSTHR